MSFITTTIIFFLSSCYVLLLDYLASSPRSLQSALIIPVVIFLFAFYRLSSRDKNTYVSKYEKLLFLFWATVLVEMLVIATDGLQSPFLILIHLFMIALSFLFSFQVAFVFLLTAFIVVFSDITLHHDIIALFLQDPGTIILQAASLIAIIPLSYILSKQYHFNDILFTILRRKVVADEAILEYLDELILVTDIQLHILSVNDATERTVQRSRSELIGTPIFDILLLRDKKGKAVSQATLFPDTPRRSEFKKITGAFTLLGSTKQQRSVTLQIQPIIDADANVNQLSFIISYLHTITPPDDTMNTTIERARAKYEALLLSITKRIRLNEDADLERDILLLEKIESDIYTALRLHSDLANTQTSRIDIAQVCKRMILLQQPFAKAFRVEANFSFNHFGLENITPLTVKNYPVTPEQLTGPFFTVACDVKHLEFLIKKLLDIAIFLASKEEAAKVNITVGLNQSDEIDIVIQGSCPHIDKEHLLDIFTPYYGILLTSTNLHLGSGLEGFLVETINQSLILPATLDVKYINTSEPQIIFRLSIKKHMKR